MAILTAHEFKEGDAAKLPFNQPSRSQAAALGPVIKRSAPSNVKEAGPSIKIQQTTLRAFEEIAKAGLPWSACFRSARKRFLRPKIKIGEQVKDAPGECFGTRSASSTKSQRCCSPTRTSTGVCRAKSRSTRSPRATPPSPSRRRP